MYQERMACFRSVTVLDNKLEDLDKIRGLLEGGEYGVNEVGEKGRTLLHSACAQGELEVARMLIADFKADLNIQDEAGATAVMLAVKYGHDNVAHALLEDYQCPVDTKDKLGDTVLHYACRENAIMSMKLLIQKYEIDLYSRNDNNDTPLHVAALHGNQEVVLSLIKEFGCDVQYAGSGGRSVLHSACNGGNVGLVKALVNECNADIDALDDKNDTLLHVAAYCGKKEVALALIQGLGFGVQIKGFDGRSVLHSACSGGNVGLVRALVDEHKADVNARDYNKDTPLHVAAYSGEYEVAMALIKEFNSDVRSKGILGRSVLHSACYGGSVALVRVLVDEYKADVNARDDVGDTPLHVATDHGKEEVALALIKEFGCNVQIKGYNDKSVLHIACKKGSISVVRALVNTDINARDNFNDTPLHVAALSGKQEVLLALLEQFECNVQSKGFQGRSVLHSACIGCNVGVVRTLVHEYKADISAKDNDNDTPVHAAAYCGKTEVAQALIKEFGCNPKCRGFQGRSVLHSACSGGNVGVVRALVCECKADIDAKDDNNDTPLHTAAYSGKTEVALALINEFGCSTKSRGFKGRSALHSACAGGRVEMVKILSKYISPIVVDDNGNTPLHVCSASGHNECVKALLALNAPVLIRNKSGKTPKEWTTSSSTRQILQECINTSAFLVDYDSILEHAKKRYNTSEHITRVFVLGNTGVGKSSFIASLKRESLFDWLWPWRESESSVPPHTAGIVPSIHTSKHYGRVLFYDFAGDAEYYSSHAAILENLACTSKGDNIFIIVVDLREDSHKITSHLNYWVSFVQYQLFRNRLPYFFILGSHLDLVEDDGANELERLCKIAEYCSLTHSGCFLLDCCKPRSKEMSLLVQHITTLVGESPRYSLSTEGSVLLGLLEKDFQNVVACPIKTIISHITDTKMPLPTDEPFLYPILFELHELGLLFTIKGDNDVQLLLNTSRLTQDVHQLLFSKKATVDLRELCGNASLLHVGIVPEDLLSEVLPAHVTKEILIQLQYCQVIDHKDIVTFSSEDQCDSPVQSLSYLFFPALCSAEKSGADLVTSPDLNYGIGWLAKCTDSRDYFPPRFCHVLFLRLVHRFSPKVSVATTQSGQGNPYQYRCTMWKTGLHWSMREGVECIVEIVHGNRGVVIRVNSESDRAEICATVAKGLVQCILKAKAEFCHTVSPQFFLLNSTNEADYLNPDNLFAMSEVKLALTSKGIDVILSAEGKGKMKRVKVLWVRKLTLWDSLFPIDTISVLKCLENVSRRLYTFGIFLGLSTGVLDAIEKNYPRDVERQRTELVRRWLSSSLDPCWWQLAQALRTIQEGVLADDIERNESK